MPVRLELGPRDLANGEVTIARRISGDKAPIDLAAVVGTVRGALNAEQDALLAGAIAWRDEHTTDVDSVDDARVAAETGWARLPWDSVGTEGEAELATSGVTVRCLTHADGSMPVSEDEHGLVAYVARSY